MTFSSAAKRDPEQELIELVSQCRGDPLQFVQDMFPWGEGELAGHSGPDEWQTDILTSIRDGLTPAAALQIAIASGHGIGKSTECAWLILYCLSTMVDARGVVTANTATQLKTKTWAELAKWHRLCLCGHWFTLTATSIYSVDPEREKTWRCDAIPWSENKPEAFAGLHNEGKRVFVLMDEGSAIPDIIFETTEGALTDANTELLWCVFGNPTRNTGRFRECFGRYRHRWLTKQIDSRTSRVANKAQIEQWIKDYGEDSDFVRVRVRGIFPRAGSMQFIPADLVEQACSDDREAIHGLYDPRVMGVDVARFGDDATVIYIRIGRDGRSFPPIKLRGLDTLEVAARVVAEANKHKVDAIFVDESGVGGGVVDQLRFMQMPVRGVQFGAKADNAGANQDGRIVYANKRAEIWGQMRAWLKGGVIPNDPELIADLTGVEYGYVLRDGLDAIQLEKKEDMKKRGLASPDIADALCFVANTMVQTPFGTRPIETLEVGDLVTTPFGNSPVVWKWESDAERLTEVKFSDGSVLKGKGDHRIFAWNAGVVRLDAIPLTFKVEPYRRWRLALWRLASICFTEARNIGFRHAVDIFSRERELTASGFCIAACGLTITAQFRRGITSITRTRIGATLASTILSFFPALSTSAITCSSVEAAPTSNVNSKPTWSLPGLKPLDGMVVLKDVLGINNTARRRGRIESQSVRSAADAGHPIGLTSRPEAAFVRSRARRQKPTFDIIRALACVIGAARHLLQTGIGLRPVVPVSVETENVPPTRVYNLTLREHNAYYANGILAFNCLTFAYPIERSDHTQTMKVGGSHQNTDWNPFAATVPR